MAKYNIKGRAARGKTLTLVERYSRYLEQYAKRASSLARRGFTSPTEKYGIDHPELTFEEFETAYQAAQAQASKGVSATNLVREIVSKQLYFHTQKEAKALQQLLERHKIYKDAVNEIQYTLEELRTNIGKDLLSKLNEALKKSGMSSGKDRAHFIGYQVFGSP